jgi:predicted pyridoxine 5'-phosphate oxidase superfamily flavin-nucleotide-binding protein
MVEPTTLAVAPTALKKKKKKKNNPFNMLETRFPTKCDTSYQMGQVQ